MINLFDELIEKRVEVICSNGKRLVGIYEGLSYDDEDECTYAYINFSENGCYELKPEEILSMKEL